MLLLCFFSWYTADLHCIPFTDNCIVYLTFEDESWFRLLTLLDHESMFERKRRFDVASMSYKYDVSSRCSSHVFLVQLTNGPQDKERDRTDHEHPVDNTSWHS